MDSLSIFLFIIINYIYVNLVLLVALQFFIIVIQHEKLKKKGEQLNLWEYFKPESIQGLINVLVFIVIFAALGVIIVTILAAQCVCDDMEND